MEREVQKQLQYYGIIIILYKQTIMNVCVDAVTLVWVLIYNSLCSIHIIIQMSSLCYTDTISILKEMERGE